MPDIIDADELTKTQNIDALEWAKSFLHTWGGRIIREEDIDLMTGWFANAIMAGHDRGYQVARRDFEPTFEITKAELYMLAGTLSVPFMRDNPHYEMPAMECISIVDQFVREHA
jgi:hypothetical protein